MIFIENMQDYLINAPKLCPMRSGIEAKIAAYFMTLFVCFQLRQGLITQAKQWYHWEQPRTFNKFAELGWLANLSVVINSFGVGITIILTQPKAAKIMSAFAGIAFAKNIDDLLVAPRAKAGMKKALTA